LKAVLDKMSETTPILEIKDLHVSVDGQQILKGINLVVGKGEVHAIMGPNGSGKSTLSYALSGRDGYEVTKGSALFLGQDLFAMEPHERAAAGIFLGFQYPVEIPGVTNMNFLKTAVNSIRRQQGLEDMPAAELLKLVRAKAKDLQMDPEMLKRSVNVGFSGGEKKRNEMVQMAVLDPVLAILDETDSGLDIDALKVVSGGINAHRGPEHSILLITHYQRLLEYVVPDVVHVLVRGKIVTSGGKELAEELERDGYAAFLEAA